MLTKVPADKLDAHERMCYSAFHIPPGHNNVTRETMTLELAKVTPQLRDMALRLVEYTTELADRVDEAERRLYFYSDQLEMLRDKVDYVTREDLGWRGARPADQDEPLAMHYPCPHCPDRATLIAADGSQIAPNRHAAVLYYLVNVGGIIIQHGSGQPPKLLNEPKLVYEPTQVCTPDLQPVPSGLVNSKRDLAEAQLLADLAWNHRDAPPVVALSDGGLLFWSALDGLSGSERAEYQRRYLDTLTKLHDAGAAIAGYIDKPLSTGVVSLLHLATLKRNEMSKATLATHGPLQGVSDTAIFARLLGPGERSALFITWSPRNVEFKDHAESHEVFFFYLNVAPGEDPALARVEVPRWVADDSGALDRLHALLVHQARQLVPPYPYILARADELAVVGNEERKHLDYLIELEMRNQHLTPQASQKSQAKETLRGR
jgi:hypothetical protein